MAESLPKYGAIAFGNLVREGEAEIVSASGSKPLFPPQRLLKPQWSHDWRSRVSNVAQNVKLRLKREALPRVVGLVNCNVLPGQFVVLVGADNEGMTLNAQAWAFGTYAQTARRTLRWYLGAADLPPGAALAHAYWQWILPANGAADDHYRCGVIWMSDYYDLVVDEGYEVTPVDTSRESVSDAGLSFFDVRSPSHRAAATSSFMTAAEGRAFRQSMDRLGRANYVLLDFWARSGDAARKADATYYGIIGRLDGAVANFRRQLQVRESMSFEFAEATG